MKIKVRKNVILLPGEEPKFLGVRPSLESGKPEVEVKIRAENTEVVVTLDLNVANVFGASTLHSVGAAKAIDDLKKAQAAPIIRPGSSS